MGDEDEFLFMDEEGSGAPLSGPGSTGAGSQALFPVPWLVLVVDDDAEVHAMTRLVMRKFTFQGRPLDLLSAHSAAEALEVLRQQPDIALILLDVVMETEDAGLRLVARIRDELANHAVRIVLRTGQPGQLPEGDIIHSYDINDYKAKTELTAQKLATSVVAALRSYAQINDLDRLREGLDHLAALDRDLDPTQGVDGLAGAVLDRLARLLGVPAAGFLAELAPPVVGVSPSAVLRYRQGGIVAVSPDEPAVLCADDAAVLATLPPGGSAPVDQRLSSVWRGVGPGGGATPDGRWMLIPLPPLRLADAAGRPMGLAASVLALALPSPLDGSRQRLASVAAVRVGDAWRTLAAMEGLRATRRATALLLAAGRPRPGGEGEGEWQVDGSRGARLSRLAVRLAERLRRDPARASELGPEMMDLIAMGAMLYDVGMLTVPGDLPAKPGPLTVEETVALRHHTARGAVLMRAAAAQVGGDACMDFCAMLALTHHERWDGGGYPEGLAGTAIPLAARLIAVADTYDALTCPRIRRAALGHAAACRELAAAAGKQLDPDLVAAFLAIDAPAGAL